MSIPTDHQHDLPSSPGGMSDQWRGLALQLRDVLTTWSVAATYCLPDEPEWCGHDYAQHALSYLALLQVKAEDAIEHMHHGDPATQAFAEELREHWRSVIASQPPCGH